MLRGSSSLLLRVVKVSQEFAKPCRRSFAQTSRVFASATQGSSNDPKATPQKQQQQSQQQQQKQEPQKKVDLSQRTGLRDDLRKHLKPEVLKIIEGKTDTMLVKKLNFLGRNFIVRLNIASDFILKNLSQDNVFRILVKELQDPWSYYWQKIRKNGSDGQKWLESLKEVTQLPAVMDRCFREMTLAGVYPATEHFNVLLSSLAEVSDNRSFHEYVDELNRANQTNRPNAETMQLIAVNWAKQGSYFLTHHTMEFLKKKNHSVPSEVQSIYEQLSGIYQPEAIADYTWGKGDKPQYFVHKENQFKANQAKIYNSIEASLQPPLEKLVVVEEE